METINFYERERKLYKPRKVTKPKPYGTNVIAHLHLISKPICSSSCFPLSSTQGFTSEVENYRHTSSRLPVHPLAKQTYLCAKFLFHPSEKFFLIIAATRFHQCNPILSHFHN